MDQALNEGAPCALALRTTHSPGVRPPHLSCIPAPPRIDPGALGKLERHSVPLYSFIESSHAIQFAHVKCTVVSGINNFLNCVKIYIT